MTKKLLTILTAAMLSQIGCHSLIHRPTDTPTQTFAKTATRVLLVVPTIAVSEMAILEAEQREGLYPRPTPEQREGLWTIYITVECRVLPVCTIRIVIDPQLLYIIEEEVFPREVNFQKYIYILGMS